MRSTAAGCLAIGIGAVLIGRGGGMSKTEREDCELGAENAAAARVVAQAFAEGKLGTRAEVQGALSHDRVFGTDGRMLPYGRLTPDARVHLDEWMNTDSRVLLVTLDAQTAARKAVEANPPESCR